MKNIVKKHSLLPLITITIAVITLTSCSSKMTFVNSRIVPAADGYVSLKSDKNNNHSISIHLTHLAPASQLSPPYKTYVVWMTTENSETKNIGQLKSASGFMSKALKASLTAVTPFKPTSFFITAEDEGNVEYPGLMVLSTR